jgi:hypothetical protein
MAQFEKLQELWQGQAGPAAAPEDTVKLTRSLASYGRRQDYINAAKALVIFAVLAAGARNSHPSPATIAGLSLVGIAAMVLVGLEWRAQRAIARLDFSAPSLGFVRSAIDRLLEQRAPARQYYWPFMGALVLGMNLVLWGVHRVWIRVLACALLFVAFETGSWVRRRRFELECRPLIDQLSALRTSLEEPRE